MFIFYLLSVETSLVEKLFLFFLQYVALKAALRINKALNEIQNTGAKQCTLENFIAISTKFLYKREELPEKLPQILSNAEKQICCLGISLPALATANRTLLVNKYESGCDIRILLTDPSKIRFAPAIMTNFIEKTSLSDLVNSMNFALPYKNEKSENGGTIEARLLPSFPGYGLQIIDPDAECAKIKVEIYTTESDVNSRPNFFVVRETQNYWFRYFRADFDRLWKMSNELTEEKLKEAEKLHNQLKSKRLF